MFATPGKCIATIFRGSEYQSMPEMPQRTYLKIVFQGGRDLIFHLHFLLAHKARILQITFIREQTILGYKEIGNGLRQLNK